MAQTRFGRQEFEIALEVGHGGRGGERSVSRHDHGRVELEHAVAGGDPVGHRARPHDRVAAVEEDVAREDDPVVGEVDHDVAGRVGRSDLQQGHRTVSDRQVEPALERRGRQRRLDVVEGERCEDAGQELSGRTERGRSRARTPAIADGGSCAISSAQRADAMMSESGDERVAVAVVPVGVGVDDRVDPLGRGRHASHRLEHLAGQPEIEERVHEE